MRVKEVLLFPGSFSPLHVGHLCLANYVIEQMPEYDELWFLLTPSNPFKEKSQQLLPQDFRRRWAEHVMIRHPRLKLSLEEFELPRPNFTYDTLTHLRDEYSDCHFSLLVGTDSLLSLPHWHRGDEIMVQTPIVVYPRPGYDVDDAQMPKAAVITMVQGVPTFDISSTRIRQMLREGADLPYFLSTSIDDPLYAELRSLLRSE